MSAAGRAADIFLPSKRGILARITKGSRAGNLPGRRKLA
jgi:hypothetical protein